MDELALLGAYAEQINRRLSELLPTEDATPQILHQAMRYSALAPGKRIRPALCLGAAEAVGGSVQQAIDGACAIELVHCFSLIHDDLPAIDNDELRRGRPTCHVKFGEAMAILAGDALFALAFEVLAHQEAPPEKCIACIRMLTHAVGTFGLVGGEAVDVLSEGQEIDGETLSLIHNRKTASLIACACAVGGILGGGTDREVQALSDFGHNIGLAFQIVDDILNETSTPEQLGKAAGSDRERKKATYPRIYGLEESRRRAEQAVFQGVGHLASFDEGSDFLHKLARFTVERLS